MSIQRPRSESRAHIDDHTRVTLLEDDADNQERRQARFEAKIDSIKNWLVTGAITFGVSAVLLGINAAMQLRHVP